MVCIRCEMVVSDILSKHGIKLHVVKLGEASFEEPATSEQIELIRQSLLRAGLELMDDKKSVLIQKIKSAIIELVHYSEEPLVVNLSDFLSQQVHLDYTYIANLFSEVQGTTIEKFYITHKIERVKELLVYNELTLTEIAYKMHYSSVAHLSNQFKKVTGLTPSYFKQLKNVRKTVFENDLNRESSSS